MFSASFWIDVAESVEELMTSYNVLRKLYS
jgi:hypothetical protein